MNRLVDVSSYFNLMEYRNLMSAGDTEGVLAQPSFLQNADGGLGQTQTYGISSRVRPGVFRAEADKSP